MASPAAADEHDEPSRDGDGAAEGALAEGAVTAAFLQGVGLEMGAGPLTAGALARAVARLLPVDAVGLSTLVDELRLPLGASTAAAERAEELQTTLGDGPCLAAAQDRAPCEVDLPDLLRRWPVYGAELIRRTPYRSTASVPIRVPDGQIFAALDLYSEDPSMAGRLDLDLVSDDIGASLGALLDLCMQPLRTAGAEDVVPRWYADATSRRQDVWVAIGMVMGRRHQRSADALSLLRGYAYSHERGLDDVAADLIEGRVKVADLE